MLPFCPVFQAEFSLGKFDRSSVEGTGEELFRPGMEGEEGAIVLEVRCTPRGLVSIIVLTDEHQYHSLMSKAT